MPKCDLSRCGAAVDGGGHVGRSELALLYQLSGEVGEQSARQMGRKMQHQPPFDEVLQPRGPFVVRWLREPAL